MGSLKRSISVAIVAGALGISSRAHAQGKGGQPTQVPVPADREGLSDDAELARIAGLVEAAKYEQCVAELDRLLDPNGKRPLKKPEVVETARVYQATCYIGLGKPELADEPLRQAIRTNPQMRPPDSLIFPQKVVERFLKVRESLIEELRETQAEAIERARHQAAERQRRDTESWARMLMLERLAREEVVVVKNRRWIAAVPFGVGQFQNGNEPLGWAFLATETALGITALASLTVHSHLQSKVDAAYAGGGSVEPDVNPRLDDWMLALQLSTYGFLGMAAFGIAEAQLNFVPEVRTVRERRLPKTPAVLPGVSFLPRVVAEPGGVELGVVGRF